MNRQDKIYQQVTDTIIEQLKNGALPWLRPWSNSGHNTADGLLPYNGHSRRPYHGINTMMLWAAQADHDYSTNAYLTYKQAREHGGHITKGEHGHTVYFWKLNRYRTKDDDGEPMVKTYPLIRSYTVFNFDQCTGVTLPKIKPQPPQPHTNADTLAALNTAKVQHNKTRAYYTTDGDYIGMPNATTFKTLDAYEATLYHELTHWSGNKARLDRTFGKRFGDHAYAFEELVAEMGSAFLCAVQGVKGEARHAGYLNSWLTILKQDNRAIFTAASKAQAAADYLTKPMVDAQQVA